MNTNRHDHHDFREAPGLHGPYDPHDRRRGGRPPEGFEGFGRRFRRCGDVQVAVLLLLAEEPTYDYQLMQTIAERTDGAWPPSPSTIHPTLSQLEDEDLVRIDTSGGRRKVSLTGVGRAHIEEHRPEWLNPLASRDDPRLRELMHSFSEAARQIGRTGANAQRQQTAQGLTDVRRQVYLTPAGDKEQAGSL